MSTRATVKIATLGALAMLAVSWGVGSALSAGSTPVRAKQIVPIAMKDPGCHWFLVGGKYKAKLAVQGTTAFLNNDEAALIFKGAGFKQKVPVGHSITISKGHYKIRMVGQPSDDNVLKLVVK